MTSARTRRDNSLAGSPGECLVLVGPEGRGKDFIVASARRRFAADARLDFPRRIETRNCGAADGHVAVSRSVFRDLAASGGLFVSWSLGGHCFGLPRTASAALGEGRTIVFAATEAAAAELASRGERVCLVEVGAGPDTVRARAAAATPLIERAAARAGWRAEVPLRRYALSHVGDIAAAVRAFHGLILQLRTEHLGSEGAVAAGEAFFDDMHKVRARIGVPHRMRADGATRLRC